MIVTINREPSTDEGTFGKLRAEHEGRVFQCETLELPWRSNKRLLSCIPTGSYQADWSHSGRFGKVYRLRDVPGRSGILIHAGNFAGDKTRGRRADVEGCILLGHRRGVMDGQPAILESKKAILAFSAFMDKSSCTLLITQV